MQHVGEVSEISYRLLNRVFEPSRSMLLVRHPSGGREPLTDVIKQASRYVSPLLVLRAQNKAGEAGRRPFGSPQFVGGCSQQER